MNLEFIGLLTVLIIPISVCAYVFYHKHIVGQDTPRTAISSHTPASAALLLSEGVAARHLTAMLLHCLQKGYVRAAHKSSGEEEYYVQSEKQPSRSHEIFFLRWLFHELGAGGKFYPSDVWRTAAREEARGKFLNTLELWESKIQADLREQGLTRSYKKMRYIILAGSMLLAVTGALFLFTQLLITFTAWTGSLLLLLLLFQHDFLTSLGKEEKNRLLFYRNSLKNELPEHQSAEELTNNYIYAVAFDLKKDYEKKYPLLDASSAKIEQERFPLYMAGSGTAVMLLPGLDGINDLETAFHQIVEPEGNAISDLFNDSLSSGE